MSTLPVLSIDTSYDPASQWFANGRTDLYKEIGAQFDVDHVIGIRAERNRVLGIIRRAEEERRPFRAIVVSSHGEPSRVRDDDSPDGILLAADHPPAELTLWAKGRVLYFCCCDTARGPLFEALKAHGALATIGFTGKPHMQSDGGRRLWRDFDKDIIRCILHEQSVDAVRAVRGHFLDRIRSSVPNALEPYRSDLSQMSEVLSTMAF